jgi:hypothetical protein
MEQQEQQIAMRQDVLGAFLLFGVDTIQMVLRKTTQTPLTKQRDVLSPPTKRTVCRRTHMLVPHPFIALANPRKLYVAKNSTLVRNPSDEERK